MVLVQTPEIRVNMRVRMKLFAHFKLGPRTLSKEGKG